MHALQFRSHESSEHEKRIDEYQAMLGDAVVLLLEIKNRPGTSQPIRIEIDRTVEKLHKIVRELPSVASSRTGLGAVFRVLEKVRGIWEKLSSE